MITLASGGLARGLQQHFLSLGGLYCSRRFKNTIAPYWGKFSSVNYINTRVQLKGQELEIDRTAYIGLKTIPDLAFPGVSAAFEAECGTNAKKHQEGTQESTDVIVATRESESKENLLPSRNEEVICPQDSFNYLNPTEKYSLQELPEQKKHLFEKYRGSIFLYFPAGVELLNYFFVNSQNISWNQTTLLCLLMYIKELNGDINPQIMVEHYLADLNKYGIKSANWSSSVKKYFEVKGDTSVLSYNKSISNWEEYLSDLDKRLEVVDSSIRASCEHLSGILESSKQEKKLPISHSQVIHTLACLATSEKISDKDLVASLNESGIGSANLYSSLSSKSMASLLIVDRATQSIALSKNKYLFETLQKYAAQIAKANSVSKQESHNRLDQIFLPISEQAIVAPLKTQVNGQTDDQELKRTFKVNGYVSLLGDHNPKVYVHLPNRQLVDNVGTRKLVIAIALRMLSLKGEGAISYSKVNEILVDNRLSKMALPRDLLKKEEFLCDLAKRTVSLSNPEEVDVHLSEIKKYEVKEEDITEKMKVLIPIIKATVHKTTTPNELLKTDLLKNCRQANTILNFQRDFSRLFGFCAADKVYLAPHPFNQAVSILSKKEKKKSGEIVH